MSAGDKVWGRVRNVVDYGAFIDLGCVDGRLHLSGISGAVNGTIGEKLTVTPLAEGSLDGLFNLPLESSFEIRHLVAEGHFQIHVAKNQGDEC